jgi:4'-phosphopantetheinyl transferase
MTGAGDETSWLLLHEVLLPAGEAFLSSGERARAAGLRVPSRRRDFLLGRYAARCALARFWRVPSVGAEVEIRAAPNGAPEVLAQGRRPASISLSHSGGCALCLVGEGGLALGADLEQLEERSPELVDQFFCPGEQRLLERCEAARRPLLANLIWSAKESAAKVLREGLRLDLRTLEVVALEGAPQAGWVPLTVAGQGQRFEGFWREEAGLVLTVLGARPLRPPERLLV